MLQKIESGGRPWRAQTRLAGGPTYLARTCRRAGVLFSREGFLRGRPLIKAATLAFPLALGACASSYAPSTPTTASPTTTAPSEEPKIGNPAPAGPVSVRHIKSTEPYEDGRFHLFLFTPEGDRPLDTRIRLARDSIAADPNCVWIDAPQSVIEKETAQQGETYSGSLLAAPVRCS